MITTNIISDKKTVKQGQQTKKILLKINGEKQKNKKRIPLNICLAIDVSGSMNDIVSNRQKHLPNETFDNIYNYNQNYNPNIKHFSTKLNHVKSAALKCIDLLNDGDIISLVLFNEQAKLIQPATQITQHNKTEIKQIISSITANGSTNLHEGWLTSGLEVAKNLSKEKINRIILLTDGETNCGIVNATEIIKATEGLSQRNISTTTLGVGDFYNENLLEKIATKSGGNFYHIENGNKTEDILTEEFLCLNNIIANNLLLSIETNNTNNYKCINELEKTGNEYIIGNFVSGKEINILIEFDFNATAELGTKFLLGKLNLTYTDNQGIQKTNQLNFEYYVVSEQTHNEEVINQEIEIQTTILEIAAQQKKAKDAITEGRRNDAYTLLKNTIDYANIYAFDGRIKNEINAINTLINEKDEYTDQQFSKTLTSMSYNIRNCKK